MKVSFPAVTAIALCTACFSQTGFAGNEDAVAAMFKNLDANSDGFITMKEAKVNADIFESFTDGDSNDDGKLSMDEFTKMNVE